MPAVDICGFVVEPFLLKWATQWKFKCIASLFSCAQGVLFLQNTYQNHSAMTVLFPAVWSGRRLCKIIPRKRDGYEPIPSPVLEELSRSSRTTSSFLQYRFKFLTVLRQEVGGQHQGKPVVPEIHNAHTLCRGCGELAYLLCCGASRTLAARFTFSCPPLGWLWSSEALGDKEMRWMCSYCSSSTSSTGLFIIF